MIPRNSSSASGRPRRTKSTASIKPLSSKKQFAGFESQSAARQDAVTAAELAFERANDRYLGGKTDKSPKHSNAGVERSSLTRQKSIRFAGPSAVPIRNHSITCRTVPGNKPLSKAQDPPWHAEGYLIDAEKSTARSSANVSPFEGEDFNEHGFASQPSSYRRLRKAKSMFTPGKEPSAVFPAGMPKAGRHFQRQSVRSSDSWGEPVRVQDPRLRKSFSFIQGMVERLPTTARQHAINDEAVQLARDKFVADLEKQRLKEQSSLLDLVKRRKPPKAFRRTVRTSSTNSYGSAIASPRATAEPLQSSGLGDKARTFSQNLRKKLKKVFGRSTGEGGTLPVQHLDASRAHFGHGSSIADQVNSFYPSIPSPNAELLRRVASRDTLRQNEAPLTDEGPGPRTIRSVASQEEMCIDKSRVTSWNDSTATNTVHVPFIVERKRLSVIREDGGPHQPSSSSEDHGDILNGYTAFRQPFRQGSAGMPPEPQRIFSALQREIVRRKSQGDLDSSDSGVESVSDQTKSTRSFTAQEHNINRNQDLFSLPHQHLGYAAATENLTPQQLATLNELNDVSPKRPLHEVGSGFFHANKHIEQKRGRSPYRQAMGSSTEENTRLRNNVSDIAHIADETLVFQPMAAKYHFSQGPKSESIYSHTSGAETPKALGSSGSLIRHDNNVEPGTAIILATETAQQRNRDSHLRQCRDVSDRSSKSSGEWKKRLASDMAYFNDQSYEDESIYNALPVKETRHKRESAQMNGDEIAIGRFRRIDQLPHQAPGLRRSNSYIHSARSNSPKSMLDHFQFNETTSSNSLNVASQVENSPPVPPLLHNQGSSRSEIRKDSLNAHVVSHSLRSKDSQASLKQRDENVNSTRNRKGRYSPERAERLQRLKSKSSLSLHKGAAPSQIGTRSGFLMESKSARNIKASPINSWLKSNALKENSLSPDHIPTYDSGNKHLVEKFLNDRRREMRISEESGGSPAFL